MTEELSAAISSRVTGLPPLESDQINLAIASLRDQQSAGSHPSGLLSTLSDLFPGGSNPPAATSAADNNSLYSVLQTLAGSYGGAAAAAGPIESSTPVEPSPGVTPPTFQFSTPPPAFAMVPTRFNPLPPITEGGGTGGLPDILAPLSPSPDQEPQLTAEGQDVMNNVAAAVVAATDSTGTTEATAVETIVEPSAATGGGAELQDNNEAATGEEQVEPGTSGAPAPVPTTAVSTEFASILGDLEIPEGVDPSFLAALPEDMRREVIEEQRRLLRSRQPPPAPVAAAESESMAEVNPEFLAALPPNIQQEVLAQQRLEQQRQAAVATDPAAPVDPGEFLQTLPPSLRQSLLAEMEESQISALPAEIAAEAQTLRRDFEQRNRAMMHERFFNHVNHPAATLSSILRSTVNRMGSYTAHNVIPSAGGAGGRSVYSRSIGRGGPGHQHSAALIAAQTSAKFKGRQLLDHEGLSCLLILLFIDDTKLNTTRLHRILRNLCYHAPTRDWVIKCLLSILEKANCCTETSAGGGASAAEPLALTSTTPTPAKLRKSTSKGGSTPGEPPRGSSQTSWLNISMDAALGFRANVFQVQRPSNSGGKKSSSNVMSVSNINVHPQAAPVVCKNTLEVLISLAKSFSIHFLPSAAAQQNKDKEQTSDAQSEAKKTRQAEFWDTLLKLDKECWTSKKVVH